LNNIESMAFPSAVICATCLSAMTLTCESNMPAKPRRS
jgi:hypothetical protein